MDTAPLIHQGEVTHMVTPDAPMHERGQAGMVSEYTWTEDAGERQES